MDTGHSQQRPTAEAPNSKSPALRPSSDATARAFLLLEAWEAQGKAYIGFLSTLSACFGASSLLWGLSWTAAGSLHGLDLDGLNTARRAPRDADKDLEDESRGLAAPLRMVEARLILSEQIMPERESPEGDADGSPSAPIPDAVQWPAAIREPMMRPAAPAADLVGEWELWRRGATDPRL